MTQDRPDAPALLDAVAEYLFSEVRYAVPREQRFRVLVAANICAVIAREWRTGEEPLQEDLELFRGLLGAEPSPQDSPEDLAAGVRAAQETLCARLRAGEMDDRLDDVAKGLRAHVRRKLSVARPGYDV